MQESEPRPSDEFLNRAQILPVPSRCVVRTDRLRNSVRALGARVEEGPGARRSAPADDEDFGGQPSSVFPVVGAVCGRNRVAARHVVSRAPLQSRFAPIALSAPTMRRSLVPLGAVAKLLARQRLPLLLSTPYRDRGTSARCSPAQQAEDAFLARPAGTRAGSPRRISREAGAADPRRSAATPPPSLEIDVGTPAESP
jgi:hypothetical protein